MSPPTLMIDRGWITDNIKHASTLNCSKYTSLEQWRIFAIHHGLPDGNNQAIEKRKMERRETSPIVDNLSPPRSVISNLKTFYAHTQQQQVRPLALLARLPHSR